MTWNTGLISTIIQCTVCVNAYYIIFWSSNYSHLFYTFIKLYMLVNSKDVLILLFLLCLSQMFHHILTREREVFWQYGEVTCAAFSLNNLDTVSKLNPTRFAIIF